MGRAGKIMLKFHLILFFFSLSLSHARGVFRVQQCGSKSSGPTENPVAALYGNETYPWTNNMVNWSCVYNVKDFGGSFQAAQKAAVSGGGGVIFFPAGTYSFSSNVVIENNIVIRGESTSAMAKKGTSPGPLAPKTIFKCTFGEHLGVFNNDPQSKNIGIVNVDLNGCAVMFWPALKTVSKYTFKSYWYEATDVIGMGANKLVFGNKIHEVTYKYPDPDDKSGNIWPWSFSTAIASYSDNNTLVANNLISRSTTSMKTTVTLDDDKMTVPYPVDNRYGIDVNQVLLGGVISKYDDGHKCPSEPGKLTPACAPWYFRHGLVIRDNYIYMNGRVGVSWSGGGDGKTVGSGTQLYNNHVEVASGTTCWSVNGKHKTKGSSTNENRGYNQQGYASNLTMNTGHINRQKASDTTYLTVDGEGILHQASNGNDGLRNLWFKNDLSGGSTGYLVYYKLFNVEYNQLISNTAAQGFFIGVVTDAAHNNVQHNTCKDNHPKCKGM